MKEKEIKMCKTGHHPAISPQDNRCEYHCDYCGCTYDKFWERQGEIPGYMYKEMWQTFARMIRTHDHGLIIDVRTVDGIENDVIERYQKAGLTEYKCKHEWKKVGTIVGKTELQALECTKCHTVRFPEEVK